MNKKIIPNGKKSTSSGVWDPNLVPLLSRFQRPLIFSVFPVKTIVFLRPSKDSTEQWPQPKWNIHLPFRYVLQEFRKSKNSNLRFSAVRWEKDPQRNTLHMVGAASPDRLNQLPKVALLCQWCRGHLDSRDVGRRFPLKTSVLGLVVLRKCNKICRVGNLSSVFFDMIVVGWPP